MAHEFRTCCECGEVNHFDHMMYNDGEHYCEECFFELYKKCDSCHEFHLLEDEVMRSCPNSGDVYCEECFEEHIYDCTECTDTIVNELRNEIESLYNVNDNLNRRLKDELTKEEKGRDVIREELKKELIDKISRL